MLRLGKADDLPALTEIYNYEIVHGTATFDLLPLTVEQRRSWFEAHVGAHRLTVWEEDGTVAGYATLSPFNPKAAYDGCVELSVYIDPRYRGKSGGRALMTETIRFAKEETALRCILSLITADNAASKHLHESLGFSKNGTLEKVGEKFGRILDVDIYELIL